MNTQFFVNKFRGFLGPPLYVAQAVAIPGCHERQKSLGHGWPWVTYMFSVRTLKIQTCLKSAIGGQIRTEVCKQQFPAWLPYSLWAFLFWKGR